MITITKAAADQIREAAKQSAASDMPLRLAASQEDDGSISYGMGFDAQGDHDVLVTSEGIDVVFSEGLTELLMGTTLDYAEINPGEHRFIFINPNDPSHKPPQQSQ